MAWCSDSCLSSLLAPFPKGARCEAHSTAAQTAAIHAAVLVDGREGGAEAHSTSAEAATSRAAVLLDDREGPAEAHSTSAEKAATHAGARVDGREGGALCAHERWAGAHAAGWSRCLGRLRTGSARRRPPGAGR